MPRVLLPFFDSQLVGPSVFAQLHTVQLTLVSLTHESVELGNTPDGDGAAATAGFAVVAAAVAAAAAGFAVTTEAAGRAVVATDGEAAACEPGLQGQMRPYPFGGAAPEQVAAEVPG